MRFVERDYRCVRDVEIEKLEILADCAHVEHHGQVHLQRNSFGHEVDRNFGLFIRDLGPSSELECDFANSIRHNWHMNDDMLPRFDLSKAKSI